MPESTLSLRVQFSGGLELLFSNQRSHKVSIPAHIPPATSVSNSSSAQIGAKPADLQYLILHLRDHLLTERPELFIEEGTVLVLIGLRQIMSRFN